MPSTTRTDLSQLPELTRARRAIVVVDVVESVRLMQEDEAGFIERWRRFVHQVRTEVLPKHGGRLVKSLGDGMLLEFKSVRASLGATRELQHRVNEQNSAQSAGIRLHLRFGGHIADLVIDEFDVFGSGVNLASRLASLATPGQLVFSAEYRDEMIPGIDGAPEDLGECYLKHVDHAVRAFRLPLTACGSSSLALPLHTIDSLKPLVAVVPAFDVAGDTVASTVTSAFVDDLVSALSMDARWAVVSRLSSAALAGCQADLTTLRRLLGAQFAIRCGVSAAGAAARVRIEVVETKHGETIDATDEHVPLDSLFSTEVGLAARLADFVALTALSRELRLPHVPALPNTPSYSLLLRAMTLLHRLGQDDMTSAKAVLDHLVDRHPRSAEAQAWSAKWHFLQLAQVTQTNHVAEVRTARAKLAQGLDAHPNHAMSLALEGHLLSFVDGDLTQSEYLLREAVKHGPNETSAWIYLCGVLSQTGRGSEAVMAIEHAIRCAPLDPHGYEIDLFAADAYKAAGDMVTALSHAERSVRQNALHLSAWVQLIVLQMLNGQVDQGRASAQRYMLLRPGASVKRYLDRHPARGTEFAERDARALVEAGIPN